MKVLSCVRRVSVHCKVFGYINDGANFCLVMNEARQVKAKLKSAKLQKNKGFVEVESKQVIVAPTNDP